MRPSRTAVPALLAIALLAAWWAWPRDPLLASGDDAVTADDGPTAPAIGAGADTHNDTPEVRVAPAATPPAAAPAAPAYAFEIVAHYRDAYGLPREHGLTFGPDDGTVLGYAHGFECIAEHELRYRWAAAQPRGTIVVAAGLLRRVVLAADRPMRLAVGADLAPAEPAVQPSDAEWDPFTGPHLSGFGPRVAPHVAFVAAMEEDEGRWGAAHFGIAPSASPGFRRPPRYGTLAGAVLAPNGEPARDFVVRLVGRPDTKPAQRADDGGYVFPPMLFGTYELEAGSKHGGTVRTTVPLRAERVRHDLHLVAGPAVRGRVADLAGAPLANVRLVWCTDDGDYTNHVVSGADGTFTVPVRTGGATTGMVWACVPPPAPPTDARRPDGARWPAVGCAARPDAEDVALVLDPAACRGSLRLPVPELPGLPPRAVTARLWQDASGLGMRLVRVSSESNESVFAARGLPAGRYTVELCSPAFGVVAGGAFWSDGVHEVELPRAVLPSLCAVTFALPEGTREPSAFELVRTSSVFPSRLFTTLGITATQHLAAGDYELWWRFDVKEPARSLAFTVARDAATLEVPLR